MIWQPRFAAPETPSVQSSGIGMGIVLSILALFSLWIYRYKFPAIFLL